MHDPGVTKNEKFQKRFIGQYFFFHINFKLLECNTLLFVDYRRSSS